MKQKFGPVQTIPDAVLNKLGQSAAIGQDRDGMPEAYFFANGAPGTFYALDAATGEKRFSMQVAGASIVWAMTSSPNGSVYFASSENGRLFRYSPDERTITELGANPSGSFVWAIDASPDGRWLYGAVYPKGRMFEYDTQTGTFKDLGAMMEGKEYVRGLGVDDRYVYAGLGTYAGTETRVVIRYDRETGEKTDIAVPTTSTFFHNIFPYGGKLFIAAASTVYVVDEATLQSIDTFGFGGQLSRPSPEQDNVVYYTSGSDIYSYRLDTGVRRNEGALPPLSNTNMKALSWIRPAAGPYEGKFVLAGITSYGDGFLFDPASGGAVRINFEIAGSPVQTHSMKAGPDGKLYLGGYHQGVSVYDPAEGRFLVHQFHTLQPESIGFLNGKAYFGMYGGAQIYEYDPARPWQYGAEAGNNPYRAYVVKEQDRPYVFASGDNKLFIGTIPDYGRLGGKLAVYDASSNTWKEYGNSELVHNQCITGLAYRNGKLFGSTSVKGGLGMTPTESEAKLFLWDAADERMVAERVLDLPGHNPPMIGNLAFDPDGLLWGATGSAVFALDPDTLDTVKSRTLYDPKLDKSGSWRPFDLIFGEDGYIYSTIGMAVTVIDPGTLEFEQLAPKASVIALGRDGSVFYSLSGKDIYRIPRIPSSSAAVVSK
jgi:sugar lactone lactonase YvrE